MVGALFALALLSFALMGLFVLVLTIRAGLDARRRSVDQQAAVLVATFEQRHALARDAEAALAAVPDAAARLRVATSTAAAGGTLAAWAAADGRIAEALGIVLASAGATSADQGVVAALRARAEDVSHRANTAVRGYNAAVTEFNRALAVVPSSLVARLARVCALPLVRVDEASVARRPSRPDEG